MLAQTTGELRLAIPLWGEVFLALVGGAYLFFGARWPRTFDVLSLTVLGCLVGLVASIGMPLPAPLVVVGCGVILGALGAIFRRVMHAILVSVALAAILALGAAMIAGHNGFTAYLVMGSPGPHEMVLLNGPNLACDAVLAATLAGLLGGAAVAVARMEFSERLIATAQGVTLILLAVGAGPLDGGGEGRTMLAFPMTLAVVWVGLVAAGVALQAALARRRAAVKEDRRMPA